MFLGLADKAKLDGMKFYVSCGDEDDLLKMNREFADKLKNRGTDVAFKLKHGGHEWLLGDEMVKELLEMIEE